MKEIGSEFALNSAKEGKNQYLNLLNGEKRYVLSGRTALAHIADDISHKQPFYCVALPDYCCGSMVVPFFSKGIRVIFYHYFDNRSERIIEQADAVLVMDYFGFSSEKVALFSELCVSMKKILIVDATQTAFSRLPYYERSHYLLVSNRKWTDSLSASVYSKEGFSIPVCRKSSERQTQVWREATRKKAEYLESGAGEKEKFLSLYRQVNRMLDEDYADYMADLSEILQFESLDSEWLRQCRRNNAKLLIEELRKCRWKNKVKLMFDKVKQEDCPLFVPILVSESRRHEIRNQMVQQDIYCPIHWPIEENCPHCVTENHRLELSLLCDQRYNEEDMRRQINILWKIIK